MKAWVLHEIGNIRYEEVPVPEPAAGEVLIRVGAAGICGSDIPRIFDTGAHRMPLIPGHEFSGEVVKTGEGAAGSWVGKRVGVFPLIPCRKCSQCKAGRYELCRNYDYIGSRRDGAFAEYVTVPAANLIELSDNVSFEEAAMLEPMAVAVHAIRRAMDIGSVEDGYLKDDPANNGTVVNRNEDTGESRDINRNINRDININININKNIGIAVYGLGTIGMFITMFLKAAGLTNLYLIGNKESQRKKIVSMGISEDCYYDNSSYLGHEGNNGANIVFECVGRTNTYAEAIDIAAPMGQVILVGNPFSDMTLPRNTYWKILRNQLTVTGTWNSSFGSLELPSYYTDNNDDWHYVLKLLKSGVIEPSRFISHRFPLNSLREGFDIMHEKREEYGKVIMISDCS